MYTNRTYGGRTRGSPGQGPKGLKNNSYFSRKKKKHNNRQINEKPQNPTTKDHNDQVLNQEKRISNPNSSDQINSDLAKLTQTREKPQNPTTKDHNDQVLNKEVPSLSEDSGGPPNEKSLNKQPSPHINFSNLSYHNSSNNSCNISSNNSCNNNSCNISSNNSCNISSNKSSHKEKQKARSKAFFQKKFKGNDQQRPKHLTQVSETVWEVKKIHQIHSFLDPQGKIIESFGEVEWKNTLEPFANMNCNHEISKCLDQNPVTFHYNDGSTEQWFLKYDKNKIAQPDYFSNLMGSLNTYKGDISKYNDQKIHERWGTNKEFKTIKKYMKGGAQIKNSKSFIGKILKKNKGHSNTRKLVSLKNGKNKSGT